MEYKNDKALALMEGCYDLHLHPNPDNKVRAYDDFELLQEMDKFKMAGAVAKLQFGETAERVWIANKYAGTSAKLYSSMVLCNALGGLNPYAVERGVEMGIKTIWMPTRNSSMEMAINAGRVDGLLINNLDGSLNEKERDMLENLYDLKVEWPFDPMSNAFISYRPGDERRPSNRGLYILDEYGMLKPEIYDILDIVKDNDLFINTGHMSLRELVTLCRTAREMKINVVMTHPDWERTLIPLDIQIAMAKIGVYIEKLWNCTEEFYKPEIAPAYCIPISKMAEDIKRIGSNSVILGTDTADPKGMYFIFEGLLENGCSEEEIRHMGTDVAKKLLNV